MAPPEVHPIAVAQQAIGADGAALLGQHDLAAAGALEAPGPGDVIGMHVRVQRGHQAQAQLAQQRQIAPLVLEHRVDQQGLGGCRIAQQVGVGGRNRIEQLSKHEHGVTLEAQMA